MVTRPLILGVSPTKTTVTPTGLSLVHACLPRTLWTGVAATLTRILWGLPAHFTDSESDAEGG